MKLNLRGSGPLRALVVGVFAAIGLSIGACGPLPMTETPADRSSAIAALAGSEDTDSTWDCPYNDNVTLKGNVNGDSFDSSGVNSFLVCSATTNSASSQTTSFKISGRTSWRYLCVFPAYYGYSSSAGAPTFQIQDQAQCFAAGNSPIQVTFRNHVNYMIIVDYDYYEAMVGCLGRSQSCPTHSEGFIQ